MGTRWMESCWCREVGELASIDMALGLVAVMVDVDAAMKAAAEL